MAPAPILLLGEGDLADEVRAALDALDAEVVRLIEPNQRELAEVFDRHEVARAVVVSRDDALALRSALMVRDADADVELLVTYFDPTTAGELCERIGNCRIVSMADIVTPTLAGPCLDESLGAVRVEDGRPIGMRTDGEGVEDVEVSVPERRRVRALARAVLTPYDKSAALLLYGALGLLVVLMLETVSAAIVLEQNIIDSFYGASKTLVTVDPNDKVDDGPKWFKTVVSLLMLIALVFEALFTAGIVNRLIDRRLTGLLGRRAVPRRDHVIVVGLGQVGLRLCLLLRECGAAVVAVDDREEGENVGHAREAGLPVVIGRGGDPSLLRRLSLHRALSLAAVTDDDLENLSIAMAARAARDDLPTVLRVGDGRLANETRSLFKLGTVRDVHRIAAGLIAARATGSDARSVICADDRTHLVLGDGTVEEAAIAASTQVSRMALTLPELETQVREGTVDTVLLGITDMQGRLQGKRMAATHFLEEVVAHSAEGCNYLLAVDVEMNTVDGYAMSSWARGYGDFVMVPDLETLRPVPWQEGTALCLADVAWEDGSDVVASPRQILRRQLARLAERGWIANAGTELEFQLFRDTYEQAWHKRYAGLEPANLYNVDYSLLGTARVEPVIRRIRNGMAGAGLRVEDSKGECNLGQHEINFRYGEALRTADEHVIFKNGAKEIAAQEGMAITFMAKFDEREGNSCHIHLSLAADDGTPLFADDETLFGHFVAGLLDHLRELTLFLAPNVNSYKRYAVGSFAPTAIAWGDDNRTCAFRVVGHGVGRRVECRVPGADVNPYLALAALVAAGLDGIDRELALPPRCEGNAYVADLEHVPATLRDARDAFAGSDLARGAFGDEVVEHYLNNARIELEQFEAAVTDWERVRGFERL